MAKMHAFYAHKENELQGHYKICQKVAQNHVHEKGAGYYTYVIPLSYDMLLIQI